MLLRAQGQGFGCGRCSLGDGAFAINVSKAQLALSFQ
jgi:hypothetical protein